jgi:acetylornithine deacetylase/succinyl-diaminopimelate desuccinylase-like protein
MSSPTDQYIETNKDRFLKELLELLRIPSVSADPKFKADVARCAEAVKKSLEAAGIDKVEICPTKGHPIVYGEKVIDPKRPRCWSMAITMCNRPIRWTSGTRRRSSRWSRTR